MLMRPSFKSGDVIISKKSKPIHIAAKFARPVVIKPRQPSFKPDAPAPRSFLGQAAFKAKEIKERGLKIDLGKTKIKTPVLDDQGNPIHDAEGNVVMRDKSIDIAEIGGTILEKFEKIEDMLKTSDANILTNQTVLMANIVGIVDQLDVAELQPTQKAVLTEALRKIRIDKDEILGDDFKAEELRFIPKLGDTPENKTKLEMVINKIIADVGPSLLGRDNRGTRISLGLMKTKRSGNLGRIKLPAGEQILDIEALDPSGRVIPTMYSSIGAAKAAARKSGTLPQAGAAAADDVKTPPRSPRAGPGDEASAFPASPALPLLETLLGTLPALVVRGAAEEKKAPGDVASKRSFRDIASDRSLSTFKRLAAAADELKLGGDESIIRDIDGNAQIRNDLTGKKGVNPEGMSRKSLNEFLTQRGLGGLNLKTAMKMLKRQKGSGFNRVFGHPKFREGDYNQTRFGDLRRRQKPHILPFKEPTIVF